MPLGKAPPSFHFSLVHAVAAYTYAHTHAHARTHVAPYVLTFVYLCVEHTHLGRTVFTESGERPRILPFCLCAATVGFNATGVPSPLDLQRQRNTVRTTRGKSRRDQGRKFLERRGARNSKILRRKDQRPRYAIIHARYPVAKLSWPMADSFAPGRFT